MEAIDEVKKLKDPNYRVSNVTRGVALYGETATKYTNYREWTSHLHTRGLEDKDSQNVESFSSTSRKQS